MAKAQAKMKMDAQAKELAVFQRQTAATAKNKGKGFTLTLPPRGTRLSKRLRGSMEEDEWQPVPDEWLADHTDPGSGKLPKTGLESDDESALTSLSDEDEEVADETGSQETNYSKSKGANQTDDDRVVDDRGLEVPLETASDFVEWETVST